MEQKNQFYNLLDDHISKLNKNKKSKFVIDQETYDKVLSALLLPKGSKCPDGASFKFWSNQLEPTELEQAPVPSTSNDQQRGWGTPPRLEEDHDDDNILINLDVEPNQVDTLLDQLGNGGATGHDDQQLDETPTTNTIITPVTPKNSKRGHNYFLLHSEDHNNIIATGTEVRSG